jgi:carbonic anhydrase
MTHNCDAIIISCIDFRFQKFIEEWEAKNLGESKFDRVALAGGIFDLYTILKQVELSYKLHSIKKVILVNHEDCGAYGAAGTYEMHTNDLGEAKAILYKLYPKLEVDTYYLHLEGNFEKT